MKPTFAALDVARQLDGGEYAALAAAGYRHVGRYYGEDDEKHLTPIERAAAHGAGVSLFVVYEDDPTSILYFSTARGMQDGQRAVEQARECGQPTGGIIFFAVDYDAQNGDIGGILAYFQALHATVTAADYLPGVYANGLVCAYLLNTGWAHAAWLSGSTGWSSYDDFLADANWSVLQAVENTTVAGISVDIDIVDQPFAESHCW